jgi:hypothetical protein
MTAVMPSQRVAGARAVNDDGAGDLPERVTDRFVGERGRQARRIADAGEALAHLHGHDLARRDGEHRRRVRLGVHQVHTRIRLQGLHA